MLVDPAPTVGKYSDFTGIVIVGFDPLGNYLVLHAAEYKLMPSDRLSEIVFLASRYRPKLIALENADLSAPMLEDRLKDLGIDSKVVSFDPRLDRKKITSDPRLSPVAERKRLLRLKLWNLCYELAGCTCAEDESVPLCDSCSSILTLITTTCLTPFQCAEPTKKR